MPSTRPTFWGSATASGRSEARIRPYPLQDQARDRARANPCGQCSRPAARCGADGRGYGCNTELRSSISALGLTYVAGILPNTTVWAPGMAPLHPKTWSGRGRPPRLMRRDRNHRPTSVKELALGLPAKAWRKIAWREGSAEQLSSRFARLRIRVAHRDYNLTKSRPEEWLLIEWPKGEAEPTKYWFSTLPQNITFGNLVDLTKLRWRIERD